MLRHTNYIKFAHSCFLGGCVFSPSTFPCLSMNPAPNNLLSICSFLSILACAAGSISIFDLKCLNCLRNSQRLALSNSSSFLTSSISALLLFFFDDPFNKCAAFPLDANINKFDLLLT
ncbi:hypothetical protein FGO68_gene4479 [Halteria grandinella]|uniref:Uncharacterized protein n=1 Tax=Halteria grandinella TaxID=5974 RepID=A0A8J8NDK7_HALGN|nr:hypothetical protein FGO68_gene4479 [Halteria grandinella]